MKPATIWLNKYLSNTWEIIALVQEARGPGEFQIVCTHPQRSYPGRRFADRFEQEPDGLSEAAYVDYCLDAVQRFHVGIFLPGRNILPIVSARERFEALGVRVLAAADAGTLRLLQNKARVYAALRGENIHVPDYEAVNDVAGFDAAWTRLRPRHRLLCCKPAVSVYGIGFEVVVDLQTGVERRPAIVHSELAEVRRRLSRAERFQDLMLMQYLPGPERSVDCLARDGELIRCVVRRKEDGGQFLEDKPEIVSAVRRLTRRFRLSNLFNVQFRDAGGKSYLLEINLRMSGGLPVACRSGLILPLWAIRLALGSASPDEIPWPRTDLWVPQPAPVSSL